MHCVPALGLSRKAEACHNIVNSQKGDPRTPRGLCPTINSQGRDPSTRTGLNPPAASFLPSPSSFFLCSGVPWLGLRKICTILQVSTVVVERMGGLSRWSELSPSRRAFLLLKSRPISLVGQPPFGTSVLVPSGHTVSLEKWRKLVWPAATGTHVAPSMILPGVSPHWSQCALHCSSTAMGAAATSSLRFPVNFHCFELL